MPIDQEGTAPGLKATAKEPKQVHMKCKSDNCDSILAVEVELPGQAGSHVYRCVKCHRTWGIRTGGSIDLG